MADKENTNVGNIEGSAIGYVRLVKGHATATSTDGTVRVLSVGDMVFPDEIIQTGPDGGVVIEFRDGAALALGGDSEALIDREVYDIDTAKEIQDQTAIIDDIQQALLAGADPTEILEAPAAGGEGGGDATSDSAGDPVAIERTGERVTPESGFETRGLQFADERTEEEEGLPVTQEVEPAPEVIPGISVSSVSNATEVEGTDLVHTVTLSGVADVAKSYSFSVSDVSTTAGVDYTATPSFTNGVTYDAVGGTISVPANVSSFDVTFPGLGDLVDESTETYTLSVDGVNGTGTITDDDTVTITNVGNATEVEGTDLVHTVTLSGVADVAKSYSFSVSDVSTTAGVDYTATPSFTNGVTYDAVGGTISVPANVSSFDVTFPGLGDLVDESTETYTLSVDGVNGTGTITDDDTVTITNVGNATEVEGTDLVHTVTLSGVADVAKSYSFSVSDVSTTAGVDYTATPSFTNGVTYDAVGGTISVPANVSSFDVTFPGLGDLVDESTETYTLSVDGVNGTGTITDDDTVTITNVGNATEVEGTDLVHTVTLSGVADVAKSYSFSVSDVSTTAGVDYTATPSFTNGVTYDAVGGTISVPANVSSFDVTFPGLGDLVDESTETYTLSVDGVNGTGTITDDDTVTITNVGNATEVEGTDLVHTVTLSGVADVAKSYSFSVSDVSTTAGVDYTATPSFTNGVTYDAVGGTISVPANVSSFDVTFPGLGDLVDESTETYTLSVDGVNGTGTITDDDTVTITNVGNATEVEGTDLVHTVTLSGVADVAKSYSFSVSDVSTTAGVDYTATPSFTNGVTYDAVGGTISVPANVSSFDVTFPGLGDLVDESTETYTLSVDGVNGTGTITDDDTVTITNVGNATEVEGTDLVHTVTLSGVADVAKSYSFSVSDVSTTAGVDYTATPSFTNGVTYDAVGGTISVPANVSSFDVTFPGLGDLVDESTETYTLSVDGVNGTGTITDDDTVTITNVGNATEVEGTDLVHTVTLSGVADVAKSYSFSVSDVSTTAGVDYTATPSFTNGVTYDAVGGTISVPANVSSFDVTFPGLGDLVDESTETYTLSVDGVNGTGTITDDDTVTITNVGNATEVEGTDLVHTVTLSGVADVAKSYSFSVSDVSTTAGVDYTATPSFTNGVTYDAVGGTISVPANVSSFDVTFPGLGDLVDESTETYTLSVDGVNGTGTITDDDTVTITNVGNATEVEGTDLVHTVTLSGVADVAKSYSFSVSDVSTTAGVDYTATPSFTNGVTYDAVGGTISVPANVSSFDVTFPGLGDLVDESTETYTLSVDGVNGTGTITDDDTVTITNVGNATEVEGTDLVHTVTLSGVADVAKSYSFSVSDVSTTAGVDYTATPSFTNGVTYDAVGGTISVPANVSSFDVTFPGLGDLVDESTETYTLSVDGVNGTGTITDDDTVTITNVGNATEVEGTDLVHTVTLSGVADVAKSYSFSVSDVSTTAGVDYTATPSFTNGVTYDAVGGTISVPANVSSFDVTFPGLGDLVDESTETYTLSVDGVNGTGTITDDDTVTITNVGNATEVEGTDLVHTVTLSGVADVAKSYSFSVSDVSTTAGVDYTATPSFTNGVTYDAVGGTISVPANVSSFDVTFPGLGDLVDESTETYTLSVDGVNGTGTITDDDTVTITNVGNATEVEGTDLVHTVTLSGVADVAKSYSFSVSDVSTTAGVDYTATPSFTNGVTYDAVGGTISVPANVSSFDVTFPGLGDLVDESTETYTLSVDGVNGTGTITDDDTVTITNVGNATEVEGTDLVHTVTLSGVADVAKSYSFSVSDVSTTAGVDYTATPSFTNGVTYDAVGGTISVPANVSSFDVTFPGLGDLVDESTETYTLSVDGVNGTGTITDDDTVTITNVGNATEVEGTDLVHTVTLSGVADVAKSYSFSVSDVSTTAGVDYTATPSFTNGVTYDAVGGTISVPANVSSFDVTFPGLGDLVDESTETYTLSVDGVNGTGTITDDDGVTITNVGNATEVEGTDLVHTVTLSGVADVAKSYSFSVSDVSTTAGVDYTATPSFTNGVTYDAVGGTISVPANVSSFDVTFPGLGDLVDESTETYTLSVDGVNGTGTITDDDTVTITNVGNATEVEGTDLVHTVTLSGVADVAKSYSFSVSDVSTTAGVDYTATPSFTNGVTYDAVGGTISVPANVSSFDVTFPGLGDLVDESTETYTLSVDGVNGTGTITDDDTVTITNVGNATEVEGTDLVHTVTLSGVADVAKSYSFSVSDVSTTAGVDYTATPSFTNGVTYDAVGGTISVPANVSSFDVTFPGLGDLVDESTETYTLSVDGVNGTGTITDDDTVTITNVGNATEVEGTDLVHTVTLSGVADVAKSYSFSVSDVSTTAGVDYTATPSFTNGVTYDAVGGTISVPANVSSFDVTFPGLGDLVDESTETYTLSVDGVNGTGTITDDDTVTITNVGNATEVEGTDLVHTVTLSGVADVAKSYSFSVSDVSTTAGVDYTATPSFTNGVTYDAVGGTISVPANVSSFDVTFPGLGDLVDESTETYTLSVDGVNGTGTITDDDTVTITNVGNATEVEGTDLVHTVTLSGVADVAKSYSFSVSDVSTTAGVDYTATPSFTNGVTYDAVGGTISVPANVSSFDVTFPGLGDLVDESTETYTLSVDGVNGTGTITDDDTVTITNVGNATEVEGTDLVHTVTLSGVADVAKSYSFSVSDVSTTAGVDYTATPSFTNGVTYDAVGGTISVPANVSSFDVTFPGLGDLVDESTETYTLSVDGVNGTGTITDDDTVTITNVGNATEVEGTDLVHTVTLSGVADVAKSYSFSVSDVSTTAGVDYTATPSFTNGVTYDAVGGTISVPANVSSFDVTFPGLGDLVDESTETYTLSVDGVNGTGTITDDDTVTITNVGNATEVEGTDLVHTVTLSGVADVAKSYSFSVSDVSTTAGVDYTATPSFTNGVTYDAVGGTISVPANVSSFDVTFPGLGDLVDESTETYTLSVDGVNGTGTITDDDTVTITNVGNATEVEGTDLVHTVTLSGVADVAKSYSFSVSDVSTTAGVDYTATPSFTNGVTYDAVGGTISVPANVSSFDVTFPGLGDLVDESTETYTLSVDGVNGTGTITDDDTVTITNVGNATEVEGTDLVHTVTLSGVADVAKSYSFSVSDVSTTAGVDYTATPSFTNGVTYDAVGGTISVPANVSSFDVTFPGLGDLVDESTETYTLSVDGVNGTGTITDDDTVTITNVGNATEVEGTDLVHTVTLSGVADVAKSYSFSVSDVSTTAGVDYTATPSFTNGVTYDAVGGTISVPANVSSFDVTFPGLGDLVDESTETYTLSVDGVNGTGTITDDDGVTITNVGNATEVEGTDLVHTVTLSGVADVAKSYSFSVSDVSTTAGVDYTATPSFTNGVTYDAVGGTISVPANVSSFDVTFPGLGDLVDESTETYTLSVDGVNGTGTITDDDTVTITNVGNATEVEGTDLVHTVTLSGVADVAKSYSFSVSDVSTTAGVDYTATPSFTNGVTYDAVGGTISVPANVSSFDVTFPGLGDLVDESTETYTLSVDGVNGTGTITDDDTVTITNVGNATEVEGTDLVHTVTLSGVADVAKSYSFSVSDVSTTAGVDYTATPSFTNGVTYDAVGGTISVPANVSSFDVTFPGLGDLVDESTETYTLSVDGVNGTGTITDDDTVTITNVGNATEVEGTDLVHTVTLSGVADVAKSYSFSVSDVSTTAGVDYTATPSFTNGVTYDAVGGTISVPANVSSFDVTFPGLGDLVDESTETYTLSVDGVNGTGTITDDDTVTITNVGNATEVEGTDLVHTVTLSGVADVAKSYSFSVSDVSTTAGVDYTATPSFTNGVTYDAVGGTISVPANVSSFDVTFPGLGDLVDESTETYTLSVDGVNGTGTITDDDTVTITNVGNATEVEGTDLVHTVTLSGVADVAKSYSFSVSDVSTTAGVDYTATPSFTNGVTYDAVGGTISVPANVSSFDVTFPGLGDLVDESTETYTLSVDGVNGTGTITDDDTVTITNVGNATEVEGTDLVHTVTLSGVADVAKSYSFSVSDVSTTAGVDYTATPSFTNGVTYDAVGGTISVPANVSSFDVTFPGLGDLVDESTETYTLSVDGVNGTGTITDDDTVTITNVGNATEVEGTDLVHTVTLSGVADVAKSYSFSVSDVSTTAGVDYTATPSFTNGVTYDAVGGTISVPANVSSFDVTFPGLGDLVDESTETYTLSVDGVNGTGTITDDDTVTITNVGNATEVEGTDLVHTVTLSGVADVAKSYSFSVSDVSTTAGVDYTATPSFTNGVTYDAVGGTISVPANVSSFDVTFPGLGDLVDESTETYTLSVDGVNGTGTITDDDTVTITNVGNATEVEGTDLVHTVTLSGVADVAKSYSFSVSDVSTTAGVDYTATPSFTNGVTYDAVGGTISVPANVSSFDVTFPGLGDLVDESTETYTLSVDGVNGTGTITDDDTVTITNVGNATEVEGTDLVHTVTLSGVADVAKSYSFSVSDVSTTAGVDYTATPSFTNGVTYDAVGGTISVPANVSSFDVTFPGLGDLVDESTETYTLSVDGVNGTGTITDDDTVTITNVGNATEVEGTDLVHTVTLSGVADVAKSYSFSVSDVSTTAGVDYTATPSFTNGVTYDAVGGTISVPANVSSFDVTFPGLGDLVDESTETYTLSVDGVNGTGTITDDDTVTITNVGNATEVEGTDLVHTVTLSGVADVAKSYSFSVSDVSTTAGVDYTATPSFTNGVTYDAVGGTISVPANVSSFDVTFPGLGDLVDESTETYTLSVDGVNGTGTITDDDTVTITNVGNATEVEGTDLVHTVTLSGVADVAKSYSFSVSDVSTTAGVDYTATPSFTNGVTYDAVGGTISVPANVSSFDVTFPGLGDLVDESTETYTLSVDGVNGTGTITDDDTVTITNVGNATEVEGTDLVHTVTLSGVADVAKSYSFSVSDVSTTAGVDYTATPSFTNGVTYDAVGGTISVPANVSSFDVTFPGLGDLVDESTETYTLSVDGVNGTGTITDDDTVTITNVGNATEVEGTDLVHTVTLSGVADVAKSYSFSVSDVSTTAGVDYTATPSFTNGVTYDAVGGTISVPANVSSFDVTFPGLGDLVDESTETYTLSVDGVNGTGSVTDDDTTPAVTESAVSGTEDTPYVFDWTDFNYTDTDGGPAQQIVITSQTVEGRLEYNGVSGWAAVTPNQTITKAEIDSGSLRFMPHVASDGSADPHESGTNAFNDGTPGVGDQQEDFATFTYQASDGVNAGNSATMTIDIEPVADAPTLTVDGTVDAGGTSLLDQVTIPTTVGLIQTVYSNTGQSPNRLDSVDLEGVTDSLAGGVSNIVAQPYRDGGNGPNNIDEDSIQVTTGIIYLTAGDQLSFDGYNDDALLIDVGGNVLIHTTGDAWGDYDTSQVGTRNATGGGAGMSVTEAGVFSAPVTGYYTFEMYIYNHSGPGDLSVNATLNGAPTPFNTANFTMYPDIASVDAADGQHSDFNLIAGDGGYYPIALNEGVEGAPIKLTAIDAALVDVDGSETLASIVISDIPEGAVLSDGGGNTFTATLGNTSVDVTAWNLDNLTFVGDADSGAVSDSYTLTVTATSEETANGDTAQTTLPLVITVSDTAPVAVDDNDSVGVEGVITGNVVTGAGGDGTGQDQVNAVDTPTGDAWLSGVDGQLFSGGSLVLDGTYGTLTIDADGAYTYQSKIVAGSITGSGNNESLWADVGYYAFDNNELPFIGATAGTGLDAALLTQGRSDDVVFNGGDLGVDADNNSDVDIDADEYIVFDLEGLASTVSVGLTDFGNNDWADWYAFAEDGSLIGSGSMRGNSNDVLDVTANIDSTQLIQYIAIQPRAGDDIEVRSLNYGVPTTQVFEDQFTYTLTDEDGDSSTAVLTIETKDHTPVAVTDTATVSESALPTGSDAAASEAISGNLFANDTGLEDGAAITTFGGSSTIVGDEITISTALGSAVVNVLTGDYTYTLENPADHSAGAVTDVISYTVEDVDGQSSSSALQVAIVDDAPVSGDLEPAVIRPVPINTELSIVFDKSGSMGSTVLDADGNPISRYELAKRAVGELVETYDAMGQVRVNIVMFDSSTEIDGNTNANGVSAWFDNAADAMAHIDLYAAGGGTDYDDPLISLEAGYSAPAAFVADQTFAYFMSDGNPNTSSDRAEIIAYENAWRSWSDTTYDKVFSIGIGSGATNTYLDLVASENPDGSENTIIIPDESQLVEMLLDTVPQVAGGQINVGGFGLNSFTPGADLPGQVLEISIEHRDYDTDALLDTVTYDTNSPEVSNDLLTVTTGRGAILQVNMQTGEYSYLASADNNSGNDFKEVVKALYQDADGDTAVASVAFFVNQTDGLHDGVTLNYDANAPVDGTTGFDTLIVPSNDALDFSGIDNISNVERLDLSVGDHAVTNLSVDDVINMTDSNQLLEILGDATDTVGLIAGDWTATGNTVVSDDGHSFAEYQDAAGSVTLLIEDTITVS